MGFVEETDEIEQDVAHRAAGFTVSTRRSTGGWSGRDFCSSMREEGLGIRNWGLVARCSGTCQRRAAHSKRRISATGDPQEQATGRTNQVPQLRAPPPARSDRHRAGCQRLGGGGRGSRRENRCHGHRNPRDGRYNHCLAASSGGPADGERFIFGSVLPDVDSLSRLFGKVAFLRWHQTCTHSIPVVISATAIIWCVSRIMGMVRRGLPSPLVWACCFMP